MTDGIEEDIRLDDDEALDNGNEVNDSTDDPDIEALQQRVREIEEEAEKIRQMQTDVERQMNMSSSSSVASPSVNMSIEEKMEVDARSVYVGNVDYGATAEELETHFHGCGSINRVTILCDKFSGHPKGFAYIEFTDKDSVTTAMALDESLFRGRQIKVSSKRTNRPGVSSTNRPPRGRGRARMIVKYIYAGGYRGGRARAPRRRGFFSPY